ncbi:MAG: diphosphomevalonate decarboxylase [Myxococcota bacterium]
MSATRKATARAHTNIALVKYWGKRDEALNLPAVGSISATLGELYTETTVTWGVESDSFELDGERREDDVRRVQAFLDRFREQTGVAGCAAVSSRNNFPTAAGLASSASGFAALTVALNAATNSGLGMDELSVLARLGSGSAPRSLFGGFVEMRRGQASDGSDATARQLADEMHWPLEAVIAVTDASRKSTGSTRAMQQTAQTSPYFDAWIASSEDDLQAVRQAINNRDFGRLADVGERSCLKMHAVAMAADPGILFWNDTTVRLMHAVRDLRAGGTAAFFTIDAGPQVKVFCTADSAPAVAALVGETPGVVRVIRTGLGPGARILGDAA